MSEITSKFKPEVFETKCLQGYSPKILIIGKKGCGKTVLAYELLWHMRNIKNIQNVICISNLLEYTTNLYKDQVHTYVELKENVITDIIQQDKQDCSTILILDECWLFTKKHIGEELCELFTKKITTIVTMQYIPETCSDVMEKVDYLFIFSTSIISQQIKLYEHFKKFMTFLEFQELVNKNDYKCLVLDNTSTSTKKEDRIFYYKVNK